MGSYKFLQKHQNKLRQIKYDLAIIGCKNVTIKT